LSGTKGLIPPGLGVVDADLARIALAAATADDRAFEVVATPGHPTPGAAPTTVYRVIPLVDETRSPGASGMTSALQGFVKSPRMLCVEASAFGGTAGRVRVLPCAIQVFGAPAGETGMSCLMSVLVSAPLDTASFASVSIGGLTGRTDTVYAILSWATPAGGVRQRRVKSTTTGAVSTSGVSVYALPTVTLGIAQGVAGSSTPGAVPAAAAGAWHVKLAEVVLPPTYTSGGTLMDLAAGTFNYVRQAWVRGGAGAAQVRGVRAGNMSFTSGADAGLGRDASRATSIVTVRCTFRHTATAAEIVLDDKLDWRRREVRVSLLRAPDDGSGAYPPSETADSGASLAQDSGWRVAATDGVPSAGTGQFWTSTGTAVKFYARGGDGALVATIAGAPLDAPGDHYTVVAEAMDQLGELVP